NSLMTGPSWSSTAAFIFWDEWGGFYDPRGAPPDRRDLLRVPSAAARDLAVGQGGLGQQRWIHQPRLLQPVLDPQVRLRQLEPPVHHPSRGGSQPQRPHGLLRLHRPDATKGN